MITTSKHISILGISIMLLALAYGFSSGDLFDEGGKMLDMPWGRVTLIDFYIGILIYASWVWYRESSLLKRASWILAFILSGNLATAVYLLKAFYESKGDKQTFFFGTR